MIIALNLTDICNFRCKMCAQTENEGIYCAEHIKKQNFNNRRHRFIELETVKKVLNGLKGFIEDVDDNLIQTMRLGSL